jgi:hypothetical protein
MDIDIALNNQKLSDGSLVYSITIGQGMESVTLDCVSLDDAVAFAAKVSKAIETHTNSCTEVIDNTN